MELRQPPCPRCGCLRYTDLGAGRSECADCGLGRTSQRMTTTRAVPADPPDPRIRRHLDDHRASAMAMLAHPPFPLVGLDHRWAGPRSLGGHGGSDGHVDHVTLAHGDAMTDAGPRVRIETARSARFPIEVALAIATQSLVRDLAMATGTMRPDVRSAAFPQADPGDPTAPWDEVRLPMDEALLPFKVLAEGSHWVALAAVGESVVSVQARHWPLDHTGLEVLDDLGAYVAGTEEQLRRFL